MEQASVQCGPLSKQALLTAGEWARAMGRVQGGGWWVLGAGRWGLGGECWVLGGGDEAQMLVGTESRRKAKGLFLDSSGMNWPDPSIPSPIAFLRTGTLEKGQT